jgi:hypothetical protein
MPSIELRKTAKGRAPHGRDDDGGIVEWQDAERAPRCVRRTRDAPAAERLCQEGPREEEAAEDEKEADAGPAADDEGAPQWNTRTGERTQAADHAVGVQQDDEHDGDAPQRFQLRNRPAVGRERTRVPHTLDYL